MQCTRQILAEVLASFPLRHDKNHGVSHWARVLANGRELALRADVRTDVVELFALLHDSQRLNEGVDREHGARAAAFVSDLSKRGVIVLGVEELNLLQYACRFHSAGLLEAPLIVQICWDADRLDLGRVGIEPLVNRLSTDYAKDPDFFNLATKRGRARVIPQLVCDEWLIEWTGSLARVKE